MLGAALASSLLLGAARAAGGSVDTTELGGAVEAFRSVCLEHVGDVKASATVAAGSPWMFAEPQIGADGSTRLRRRAAMLMLSPVRKACSLTVTLPKVETLRTTQSALAARVSLLNWQPLLEPGSSYALIGLDGTEEQFVIALKVSNQTGRNLAMFSVEQRSTQE